MTPLANGIGMSYLRSFFNGATRRFNRLSIVAAALVAALGLTVGCGDSVPVEVSKTEDLQPEISTAITAEVTTSVAVAKTKSEVSPAKQVPKLPDADASPEAVCQLFMKYLNSGDRVKAERLLTSVAFDTTAKAGLYLQPMGSADAEVSISPAIYVTNKQKLAHVECKITEIEDGEPVSEQLTWMVRKSKSGWRIFGMLLTFDEGQQDFLSLENVQDVDAILQMSGGDVSTRNADIGSNISLN